MPTASFTWSRARSTRPMIRDSCRSANWSLPSMRRLILGHTTEFTLLAVMVVLCIGLSFGTDRFLTISNAFDVLNVSAVNIIFAVGLLVVLISGGIDISFAVAASVVQYLTVTFLGWIGGGNWIIGLILAGAIGIALGSFNAFLIHKFKI